MDQSQKKRRHSIHAIFFLVFVLSLSIAIPTYINSTFLTEFTSERVVGFIYTIGSVLAILAFVLIPLVLRRLGNYRTTLYVLLLTTIFLIGLAFTKIATVVVVLFLAYQAFIRLIGYDIDLFLESFSEDKSTGSIRGGYLTVANSAWVLAPIMAGFILAENNYWRIYALAAVLVVITIPALVKNFKKYQDPEYNRAPFWRTLKNIYRRKNVYKIFAAYLLLRFFYAWMIIYMPIYLHEHVGFAWSTIGIIFTIMLLPFILLEYPLGRIADTKIGEKEIMTLGFVILAVATGALAFISSTVVWVWAIALFATRVGASMVESMGETYFFKKIDDRDSETLGFFRMTGPLAYIIAPIIASVILSIVDFRFLFLVLGVLMLWGLRYSLTIKDTL